MTLHTAFQQVSDFKCIQVRKISDHLAGDLTRFEGKKMFKCQNTVISQYQKLSEFSNLVNPEYLQLPLLGHHKSFEGVYED